MFVNISILNRSPGILGVALDLNLFVPCGLHYYFSCFSDDALIFALFLFTKSYVLVY